MNTGKGLVLDANILIRAALGSRVRSLLVDRVLYADFEALARARIAARDIDDWPVVAVAPLLKLPVWTEAGFLRRGNRHVDDRPC